MADTYHDLFSFSIKAAAAITKRRFVGYDGNLCGAGAKAFGVALFDQNINEQVTCIVEGIAVVESGGALTKGDPVESDATGRAVAATAMDGVVDAGAVAVTSSAANGNILTLSGSKPPKAINGYVFLDSATAAGEFVRVKLV